MLLVVEIIPLQGALKSVSKECVLEERSVTVTMLLELLSFCLEKDGICWLCGQVLSW